MNSNLEKFKIWAPPDSQWSNWVKPVLFTSMNKISPITLNIKAANWAPIQGSDVMYIIDQPGPEGVYTGLELIQYGFRPIPVYNGVLGTNKEDMIVNVSGLVSVISSATQYLATSYIHSSAPPAFLLDSNRMRNVKNIPMYGKFDNRWCLYPQDMPSATYLLKNNIRRIVIRTEIIQNDLAHILYKYQKAGIEIMHSKENKIAEPLRVVRPSLFQTLVFRWGVLTKLNPSGVGGFGERIPEQVTVYSGYSGSRYRGMG